MKNTITILLFCVMTTFVFAQAPNKMSFQSVVRDGAGALVSNSNVGIKISVLQASSSGISVYSETHNVSTNVNGLASLEIGAGMNQMGTFSAIDWSAGPYFLKVESDPTGGTNYTISGASELLSVPYALFAANSGVSSGWSLGGNSNLDPMVDFIGSVDDNDVIFRRNNVRAARLGTNNTSFGVSSLSTTTTGMRNTAIGSNVLSANTSGTRNTSVGESSMTSNTTGGENVAMGAGTLFSNTTGNQNTAIGRNAMTVNTTGSSNTALGYLALRDNTAGQFNSAMGRASLSNNTIGEQNTSGGVNSMFDNTTGGFNTAFGVQSLRMNISGSHNTALGFQSLNANTTGINNTALGRNAFSTGTAFNNSTALGANTIITASDQVRIGDANINSIGGEVSWTTLSDGRFKVNVSENVPGMAFISKLKPVTYNVNRKLINEFHKVNSVSESETLSELTIGFIAQDVETAAREIGFDFSGVDKPKSTADHYGLRYSDFVAPMVKAMQEQQSEIEKLKVENTDLKERLERLEQLLIKK